jgi:hypothetical protein
MLFDEALLRDAAFRPLAAILRNRPRGVSVDRSNFDGRIAGLGLGWFADAGCLLTSSWRRGTILPNPDRVAHSGEFQ